MKKWSLIIMAAMFFLITAGCTKEPLPQDRFASYIDSWNKKDFDKMYGFLSKDAKKSINKKDFVGRYQKIYEDLQIKDLKVQYKKPKKDDQPKGENVSYSYTAKMNSVAGPIDFTQKAQLKKEDKNWYVDWDTTQIFPQLKEGNKIGLSSTPPKRGSIADRNGKMLAVNGEAYEVGIVPEKMGDQKEQIIAQLSKLVDMTPDQINKAITATWVKPEYFVPLKKVAKDDQARIQELIKLEPVQTKKVEARVYPYKDAAAQLIGYVGGVTAEDIEKLKDKGYEAGDVIGKRGLEQVYEDQLRGQSGVKITIKKKDGSQEVLAEKPVQDGKEVQLTIDADLQLNIFGKMAGKAGAASAMNPITGEVLALVSSPSFDPNPLALGASQAQWKALEDNPQKPLITRFKQGYAPGSTLKPVTAGIALTNNAINPTEGVNISGKQWQKDKSWGGYFVTRVHEANPVNLETALIQSDNIYFAQTALNLGKDKFIDGLKKFSFETESDFPFPLETPKTGEMTSEISLADSGYGQGQIQTNMVHLMDSYTPFVNNGNMIKPVILMSDQKKQVLKEQVISPQAVGTIAPILRKIVGDPAGTAHRADIPGYPLSGKTGTAELKKKQGEKGTENGFFVAYNTDHPSLLVAMLVEGVQYSGGSQVPVKLVRSVYEEARNK
ncbi:penicillin-binding transpeptidase domain-containing protein [Neobacillus terrae]|uniref:penicillin-binding transpeptidase domain-containing protein n=1 Tax=Neobacillus terrae TaxID=3034837 RepID=UPI00140C32A0|nr:penicillin-binding transpeptidase domain-containing protein [Neobacillus terrae]NHM30065.1 penicillin-binding transpeptidase domain-containing protein [Neobacillus terrae]